MFGLDDEAQARARSTRSPRPTRRPTATPSRRSGRTSRAAISSIASPIPTYIVAQAVVRAVGRARCSAGRAGDRHLRRLGPRDAIAARAVAAPPVLADLYFAKVWLARRFTAPGCEPVCCDGNAPMPFARGAFGFAMCTDAFMYIWTKRQFVGEMERLGRRRRRRAGAVLIGHTHNERTWSPSHGQPLSPEGYAALFETIEPRLFGEAGLFADVVSGGPLDLSRRDAAADARPRSGADDRRQPHPGVFARHAAAACRRPPPASSAINPLYVRPRPRAATGLAAAARVFHPRTTRRSTAPAGSTCRRS